MNMIHSAEGVNQDSDKIMVATEPVEYNNYNDYWVWSQPCHSTGETIVIGQVRLGIWYVIIFLYVQF